jgi:hypothetical protein
METIVLTLDDYINKTVYLWFIIGDEQIFGGSWGISEPFKHDRMLLLGEFWNEAREELVEWVQIASKYEVHRATQDDRSDKYNLENRLHSFEVLTIIIEEVYENTTLMNLALSRPVDRVKESDNEN